MLKWMQLRVCGSHQAAHQVKELNNQTHAHNSKIKISEQKTFNNFARERDLGMELPELKKKACLCTFGKEQRMKCGLSLQHNMQSVCLCGGRTT